MATRRNSKADRGAAARRASGRAVVAPAVPAQDRAALIALVRALARDAARADHGADAAPPQD